MTDTLHRRTFIVGTLLLTLVTVLLCLIPKPENDLFFELRIGGDILRTGHAPHFDTYSWTQRGTHWDVPEWLAFALYALAFRAGGFFGTWLLMVTLTLAAVGIVWRELARRIGPIWAFPLVNLMLLALRDCLQERPYAFTYGLLAVSLIVLTRAREEGRWRLLLWLPPLCAVWANLHQGVLALIGLLLVYSAGDGLTALWLGWKAARETPPDLLSETGRAHSEAIEVSRKQPGRSALRMLGMALACAGAALLSPYGWRTFWNVFITLRSHTLMANVTEWNSVAVLPLAQLQPFLLLAAVTFGALAFSARRNLSDTLALLVLLGQASLHARNIPLFAIGSVLIAARHFASAPERLRRDLPAFSHPRTWQRLLLAGTVAYVAAVGLLCVTSLKRAIGPRGYSLAGVGEAVANVPSYPSSACAFMEAERFPAPLRLLNDFETGGYLMWRLPQDPVFVDGRLDVYVGRTFDDMLILARAPASPPGLALRRRYDFDCVLTANSREAAAFAADPQWKLVYDDLPRPHAPAYRIFLRRRPEFTALIARCQRDRPL